MNTKQAAVTLGSLAIGATAIAILQGPQSLLWFTSGYVIGAFLLEALMRGGRDECNGTTQDMDRNP